MSAKIFDDRKCLLGEGPIWHPLRKQFFWFDILNRRLLSRGADGAQEWQLPRISSAAGWVNRDRFLLATEAGLELLDLTSGEVTPVEEVEADDPETRSNDGRADRQGGFWFGTMGKQAQPGRGAIYRYYRGEVRKLFSKISIPNAICFSADGRTAFYADTEEGQIRSQVLDEQGWPQGDLQLFVDMRPLGLHPDGAVTDSEDNLCVACWGEGAVVRFDKNGQRLDQFAVGGKHSSCPAFGGDDLRDMLITTAQEGIEQPDDAQGVTYVVRTDVPGLAEPQVIL